MQYILITLLAISATTFIIYILANKVFGVFLRLKSLVLCAACALFISIVLPRVVVSFAGLAWTGGLLAVFAVICAYIISYYDDHSDLQPVPATPVPGTALQQPDSPGGSENILAPPSPSEPPVSEHSPPVNPSASLQPLPEPEITVDFASLVFGAVAGDQDPESLSELCLPAVNDNVYPEAEEEGPVSFTPEPPARSDSSSCICPDEEPEVDQEMLTGPLEMIQLTAMLPFYPALDHKPEPEFKQQSEQPVVVTEQEPEPLPPAVITPVNQPEPKPEPEPEPDIQKSVFPSGCESSWPSPPASEDELANLQATADLPDNQEVSAITSLIDLNPNSDSLDDLLDFAFYQKEHHNYPLALDTFRQALKLYQDSEAAPYMVIEIAALLKNKGAYDEAIMVLTNGRTLPGLDQNDPLIQEFITTIAYLRIVKNILLESRMGYLPFSSIPTEVSQEIDAEFREWRNLA